MEIHEILAKAWSEVEAAKLPSEIQPIAFTAAVGLLTDTGHAPARPSTSGARRSNGAGGVKPRAAKSVDAAPGDDVDEDQFYERIVAETGVDKDKLNRVLVLDKGVPKVVVTPPQLGSNGKERQIAVTHLVAVAYALGLGQKEILVKDLRAACEERRVLDDKNYNSYLSSLKGFTYLGGRGGTSRLRVRTDAETALPALVDKLLGEAAAES